jgi:hypothetical protein
MTEREEGFYWIRIGVAEPEMARFWQGGSKGGWWETFDSEEVLFGDDLELVVLSERLLPPGSGNTLYKSGRGPT